jgi:hypothetical protein
MRPWPRLTSKACSKRTRPGTVAKGRLTDRSVTNIVKASNTGARSPGDEFMTCKISAAAVYRSFASFSAYLLLQVGNGWGWGRALRALGLFARRP